MSLKRISSLFDVIKSRFSGIYDRKTAFSCHKPSKKPILLHQKSVIPSRITSGAAILLLLNLKMPRIIFGARGISAVGAHHTGSVGVTGSSPVCSTKKNRSTIRSWAVYYFLLGKSWANVIFAKRKSPRPKSRALSLPEGIYMEQNKSVT